jgi:hypothetical protein
MYQIIVHILIDVRDYPRSAYSVESDMLLPTTLIALGNCINMRRFIWTRDGALNDQIIHTLIQKCPRLRYIEINGHTTVNYDPRLLVGLANLNGISVIMPTKEMVDVLPKWIKNTAETLASLSLLCRVGYSRLCVFFFLRRRSLTNF